MDNWINKITGYYQQNPARAKSRAVIGFAAVLVIGSVIFLWNRRSYQAELAYSRALSFYGAGQPANAAMMFKDYLNRNPWGSRSEDALFFLARVRHDLDDYDVARQYYEQYIEEYPSGKYIDEAYLNMVMIYRNLGEEQLAAQNIDLLGQRITEDNYLYPEFLKQKAFLLLSEGKTEEGKQMIDDIEEKYEGTGWDRLIEILDFASLNNIREEYGTPALPDVTGTPPVESGADKDEGEKPVEIMDLDEIDF